MDLGAKTIEILAQLIAKSQIARYSNMERFLEIYEYPREVISVFNSKRYYPIGLMEPNVVMEWGSIIIRKVIVKKHLFSGRRFFVKLAVDFLNEIEDNVLDLSYDHHVSKDDIEKFHRYLELDGYKYENKMLVPIEYGSRETQNTKSVMESMIDRNQELSQEVLIQHLRDCEENYQIRHWKDSIGQARNFVEQLLEDIGKACAMEKNESPDLSRPVKVRDYLKQAGFFEKKEREKLVDGVYGYLSEEGSHPGISDDKVARVSRNIMISFGYYILEKFETWKKNRYAKLP